ncbi:hypothetical protein [Clostridium sporogenes]|nr:hypothetical protein [Clostridium sporogenes]
MKSFVSGEEGKYSNSIDPDLKGEIFIVKDKFKIKKFIVKL